MPLARFQKLRERAASLRNGPGCPSRARANSLGLCSTFFPFHVRIRGPPAAAGSRRGPHAERGAELLRNLQFEGVCSVLSTYATSGHAASSGHVSPPPQFHRQLPGHPSCGRFLLDPGVGLKIPFGGALGGIRKRPKKERPSSARQQKRRRHSVPCSR